MKLRFIVEVDYSDETALLLSPDRAIEDDAAELITEGVNGVGWVKRDTLRVIDVCVECRT